MYNPGIQFKSDLPENFTLRPRLLRAPGDLTFEIALWLSGLESFLNNWDQIAPDSRKAAEAGDNWAKEFRLIHSVLLTCSSLNYQLRKALSSSKDKAKDELLNAIFVEDCDEFVLVLRDIITINNSLLKTDSMRFDAWRAWKTVLIEKLRGSRTIRKFAAYSDRDGLQYLPVSLQGLLKSKRLPFSDQADLHDVLSRFGIIMQSLSIVGRMLRNDEPLKVAVLIFAKVHEQSQQLINFINNRITHFKDEGAELFSSLDSASYTASLELKKVYQQELTGIVGIRPAPSIHAKVETSYSLLNDSFEQILAGFARLIEPDMIVTELFPSVQLKLEQSLSLRSHLWKVLQAVKGAEQTPDKRMLDDLKKKLTSFMDEPIRFLFFKDRETLERFSEEIVAASDNKDLVPILHRFGAYLETLFSLVNMRTVLGPHPFAEPKT